MPVGAPVHERPLTRAIAFVFAVLFLATAGVVLADDQGSAKEILLSTAVAGVFGVAALTGRSPLQRHPPSGDDLRRAREVHASAEVEALVREARVIPAIRAYRQATGAGLREAREAVDLMRLRQLYDAELSPPPADVVAALARGRKLEAIRSLRRQRPSTLEQAKRAVDHYELRLRLGDGGGA